LHDIKSDSVTVAKRLGLSLSLWLNSTSTQQRLAKLRISFPLNHWQSNYELVNQKRVTEQDIVVKHRQS